MSDQFPSPPEIVMEILMSRDQKIWFIVEGENDERFFRSRPFPYPPKIAPAGGWEAVRYVLTEVAAAQKSARVLGLVDRDYRDHCGCQLNLNNLVLTDYRDIEVMMFWSSAFERVVAEKGSAGKLPKLNDGNINFDEIRARISDACISLGKLRIFCNLHKKPVSFEELTYTKIINDRTLAIEKNTLIGHLNGKNTGGAHLTVSEWEEAQAIAWTNTHFYEPQFICQGFDLMSALAISLRKLWGSHGGDLDGHNITALFRIAYTNGELETTSMWQRLMALMSTLSSGNGS